MLSWPPPEDWAQVERLPRHGLGFRVIAPGHNHDGYQARNPNARRTWPSVQNHLQWRETATPWLSLFTTWKAALQRCEFYHTRKQAEKIFVVVVDLERMSNRVLSASTLASHLALPNPGLYTNECLIWNGIRPDAVVAKLPATGSRVTLPDGRFRAMEIAESFLNHAGGNDEDAIFAWVQNEVESMMGSRDEAMTLRIMQTMGKYHATVKLSPIFLKRPELTFAADIDPEYFSPGSADRRMSSKTSSARRRRSSSLMYTEPPESLEHKSDQAVLPNLNAEWVNSKGAWTIHFVIIICLKILYNIIPGVSQELSWTLTNMTYMFGSYLMFHYVRGVPFDFNAGAYDNLNLWEQIDDGAQYTPTKKFLLSVPIILFLISTHYTHYDSTYFMINVCATLAVVIPKLPVAHRLRINFSGHPPDGIDET
ncbi:MAG: hypothetical protein Q9165_007421 [Trypethelium subeluteriae]